MKLTILLLAIFLFDANAETFSQQVTFEGRNVKLSTVFDIIEKQTGYTIFANKELLRNVRPVNVSARNMPLRQFLAATLSGQPIGFEIHQKTIFIREIKPADKPMADEEPEPEPEDPFDRITGTVRGVDGAPLEGATVSVKGSNITTVTDSEGRFNIETSPDDVLVISYVGYRNTEVRINNRTEISIVLEGVDGQIEEVVVTALGIPKKAKALSYNVQEVNGEEVNRVKDANFVNSLAGRVAGATINTSSAGIGGSARVVLRGTKSIFGNNNALYVVDGMPLPALASSQPNDLFSGAGQTGDGISNINPEDIESMSVLSGPAAAALYGSQAANGVIMITTKKGSQDGLSITVSNNTTFHSPLVLPSFQNTYGSEMGSFYSWGEKLNTPTSYDPTDFFRTGVNQTNTISLSTGTEKNQTYVSLAAVNANGIIHNNDLDRYNLSIRNTSKFLNDRLNMDLSMTYVKLEEQNMLAQGQYFNPLIPIYLFPRGDDIRKYQAFERYNPTRNFKTQFWPFGDLGFQMQNPYWITDRNIFTNNKHRFLLSGALKYDINSWMSITGRARLDRNTAINERKYYASTSGLFAGEAGSYYRNNVNTQQVYADALLNINRNFGDLSLTANIGTSIQDIVFDNSSIGGHLQSVPNLFTYTNLNLTRSEIFQDGYREQVQSVFASAQLGYKNLVYLDVTARNDWASQLANTSSLSFFYPSAGLSAIISDILNIRSDVFSYIKARASYSEVGNPPLRHISIATYPLITGYPQTNTFLPATNLQPERTRSYEAGVNLGLFRNKLRIDATVYRSSTYNQLFNPSLSPSSGFTSFFINAGQIDNKGIELALSFKQDFGQVQWTSGIVYSLNRNRITKLLPMYTNEQTGETVALDSLNMGGTGSYTMNLVEGGSMGDVYVNSLKVDEKGYIWVNSSSQTVYADPNNYIKAGNANPDFNLGFRNGFYYKGFDLNFLVNARVGGVCVSVTQSIMDAFGVSEQSASARDNGGVLVNGYPLPAQPYYQIVGGGTSGIGSMYVYSATNVRLAEASLGYEVPLRRYFNWVKGLNLSVIGRNLFMFYNKAPFDPELTANTGTYFQGVDYFMQPSLRSVGFAARVRF